MFDIMTVILGVSALQSDFTSIEISLSTNTSYPVTVPRSFFASPGYHTLVSISASKISTNDDLRALKPEKRKCFFSDEISTVKQFKTYSQDNCMLSCAVSLIETILTEQGKNCLPLKLSVLNSDDTPLCDPFESENYFELMKNVSREYKCDHCLPSANITTSLYFASFLLKTP